MSARATFWKRIFNRDRDEITSKAEFRTFTQNQGEITTFDLPSSDPLLAYALSSPGVMNVDQIELDSPMLDSLREAGIRLTLPLVSQGELVGLINLGARRSEQDYSSDDKRLLQTLATQAAPALRVAQLVRQQKAEARAARTPRTGTSSCALYSGNFAPQRNSPFHRMADSNLLAARPRS